jgi:hypothetical protein
VQVKQGQTAATYEKMTLRIHEWLVEHGYEPFAEVVEASTKRYKLQLLANECGVPCTPTVEGVVDFLMGMSDGDVDKGGSRSARAKDWYASPLWGKSQADKNMR